MPHRLMHLINLTALCLGLLLNTGLVQAQAEQRHLYTGVTLELHLKPLEETLVRFDGRYDIHVPVGIAQLLNVAPIAADRVVLTPSASFKRSVIQAKSPDGKIMLIGVTASPAGSNTPQMISNGLASAETTPTTTVESSPARPKSTALERVALMRHASQTLYAPLRLVPTSNDIRRIATPNLTGLHLIHSHKGETWEYTPVAAFASPRFYLTAIEIVNQSALDIKLDPRKIIGVWAGVGFQHSYVTAHGHKEDRTTLYLISRTPFHQAFRGVGYGG